MSSEYRAPLLDVTRRSTLGRDPAPDLDRDGDVVLQVVHDGLRGEELPVVVDDARAGLDVLVAGQSDLSHADRRALNRLVVPTPAGWQRKEARRCGLLVEGGE